MGAAGYRATLLFAIIVAVVVLGLAVIPVRGSNGTQQVNVRISKTRYYGGAAASIILRMDDFVVDPSFSKRIPDDFMNPTTYFGEYQSQIIHYITSKYPWLRPTIGLITMCPSGDCNAYWRMYAILIEKYGWEIASHSRYHTRPPRSPQDYLGSINDIESNITGYRVLTYIEPMGKTGKGELQLLREHGVRVFCDSLPSLPFPVEFEDGGTLHFTVKAAKLLPWKPWLRTSIYIALASGGTIVFYTHPTTYDWDNAHQIEKALDYLVKSIEGKGFWYTTVRDLYYYNLLYENSKVTYHVINNTLFINISLNRKSLGKSSVPLTLQLYESRRVSPKIIVNGKPLRELVPPRHISRPLEGYWIDGEKIIINVRPPAKLTVRFDPTVKVSADLPAYLFKVHQSLWIAREASYLLWGGAAAEAILVYRRRKASRGASLVSRLVKEKVNPDYTAIVPARNSSDTIVQSLESLLRQTFKPKMIVVVDDNSSDGTYRIAREKIVSIGGVKKKVIFEDNYVGELYELPINIKILILIAKKHMGKSVNIRNAVRYAEGIVDTDYLFILDSDTIIEDEYVEKIFGAMAKDERIAAANGVILLWRPHKKGILSRIIASAFRNIGGVIYMLGIRSLESVSGELGSLNGSSLMISKKALHDIGGFPSAIAEDTELTWRLSLRNYKTLLVTDAYSYTIDPGSLAEIFRKGVRISTGVLEALEKNFLEIISRRKMLLFSVILYNVLGGIPILLSLLHILTTATLLSLGMYPQGIIYRLALLLPYTPFSVLLMSFMASPLAYLMIMYLFTVAEASIIVLAMSIIYKENKAVVAAKSSLKYVFVFPIILWTNALSTIVAFMNYIVRKINGKKTVRW